MTVDDDSRFFNLQRTLIAAIYCEKFRHEIAKWSINERGVI